VERIPRSVFAFVGTCVAAGTAQVYGVPIDSPALRVAAATALGYIGIAVLRLTPRVARLEGIIETHLGGKKSDA
jgi:cytosine/uracil/thiamine/allantoin permease